MIHLHYGKMVLWWSEVKHAGTWAFNASTKSHDTYDHVHGAVAQIRGRQNAVRVEKYYNDADDEPFERTHHFTNEHLQMFGSQIRTTTPVTVYIKDTGNYSISFPCAGPANIPFVHLKLKLIYPPLPSIGNVEAPMPGTKTPRITNTRNTYSSPSAGNSYNQSRQATVSQSTLDVTYNQ